MTSRTTRTTGGPPTFLLPVRAYRDLDWFEREQRRLFTRSWSLVCSTTELSDPGDWVTTTIGGVPLLLIVGDDGKRRAFHNMCRHRGMTMMAGCGTGCRVIRCGYHDWRFDLEGALTVVPQRAEQFPGLDPAELGLLPGAIDVWAGMVFASPDPDIPPLETALGDLQHGLGSFRPDFLPVVASTDLPAACNWKLLIENHIDVYHLWYLHRESLADFDHPRFEHRFSGPNWMSYEPLRSVPSENRVASGVPIRHLDERDRLGIGAHLLFPNVLFASTAEFFMSYAVVAEGPQRSRLELRIRAEPESDPGSLIDAATSFISEDISACEAIQAAMESPWFEVGPLALTHEAPITSFHRHVLERLT